MLRVVNSKIKKILKSLDTYVLKWWKMDKVQDFWEKCEDNE